MLVRLDPELLEAIDAVASGSRNAWIVSVLRGAVQAADAGQEAGSRPAKDERLARAFNVARSAEAKVGVTPRDWR